MTLKAAMLAHVECHFLSGDICYSNMSSHWDSSCSVYLSIFEPCIYSVQKNECTIDCDQCEQSSVLCVNTQIVSFYKTYTLKKKKLAKYITAQYTNIDLFCTFNKYKKTFLEMHHGLRQASSLH